MKRTKPPFCFHSTRMKPLSVTRQFTILPQFMQEIMTKKRGTTPMIVPQQTDKPEQRKYYDIFLSVPEFAKRAHFINS